MTRKIPVWFDSSNLGITEPNIGALDIDVLNFLTSKVMPASMHPIFQSASTHVDAGIKDLVNLGP